MADPTQAQVVTRRHHWLWQHWTQDHPAFSSGPTLGERAADRMRHAMGSWGFVFGFLAVMAIWAAINTGQLTVWLFHGKPFDPYPFILLNLLLSTLAGLQGAILLIAAKRADQIAGKLALHTDRMATQAAERDRQIEGLLVLVCHKLDISPAAVMEEVEGS